MLRTSPVEPVEANQCRDAKEDGGPARTRTWNQTVFRPISRDHSSKPKRVRIVQSGKEKEDLPAKRGQERSCDEWRSFHARRYNSPSSVQASL
jgi:hypothetical protein